MRYRACTNKNYTDLVSNVAYCRTFAFRHCLLRLVNDST
jgi:hypothetical protein